MSLLDEPAHHRVLRLEIEDVVLVEPRRHDEQRPARDALRRGRVLDELHQVVLPDDLAGRDGEIHADFEGRLVRHADSQPSARGIDVVQQVERAAHEARAAGRDGLAQHCRIRPREVDGTHRREHLACVEARLSAFRVGESRAALASREQRARRGVVALSQGVEVRMLAPGRIGEGAIGRARGHRRPRRARAVLPSVWRSGPITRPRRCAFAAGPRSIVRIRHFSSSAFRVRSDQSALQERARCPARRRCTS